MHSPSVATRVLRAYGAAAIAIAVGYLGAAIGSWTGRDAEGFGPIGYVILGGVLGLGVGVLLLIPLGRAFGLGWRFGVVAAVLTLAVVVTAWRVAPVRDALAAALLLVPAVAAVVTARLPAPLVTGLRALGRRAVVVPALAAVAVLAVSAGVWAGIQNRSEDRARLEAALATTELEPVTMRDDLGWRVAEVWVRPEAITCVLTRRMDQIFVSTVPDAPDTGHLEHTRRLGDQLVSVSIRTGPDVTDADLEAVVAQLEPATREEFTDLAAGRLTDGP